MALPPPGWFDDGAGRLRWWDGREWTPHTAPLPTPTPRRRTGMWVAVACGAAALVIALVAGAAGLATWAGSFLDARAGSDTPTRTAEPRRAVEGLQEAVRSGDCDRMLATTTAAFRRENGWSDCAAFEQDVADRSAQCEPGYEVASAVDPPTAGVSDSVRIEVRLTCSWNSDENGEPADDPYVDRIPWIYVVVEVDGEWRVDEVSDQLQRPIEPADRSEASAADAVAAYNRAWFDVDCAAFQTLTTASVRALFGALDCQAFETQAQSYAASMLDFTGAPTRFDHRSSTRIDVLDRETFLYAPNPDDPTQAWNYEEYWSYSVELRDGTWVITDVERY